MKILPALLVLSIAPAMVAEAAQPGIAELLARAEQLRTSDKAGARRLLDEAERALRGADQPRLAARAQLLECRWADAPEPARRAAELALAAAQRAGDARLRAEAIACRAYGFYAEGREHEAERDYLESARIGHEAGAAALEADSLATAGFIRYGRGATADALADLQKAYAINVRLRREPERLDTLTMIANVYAEKTVAQYDRAIEHYQAILKGYEALGRPGDVGDTLFNLGSTYQKKDEIVAALQYYRRAVSIYEEAGKKSDAAYTRRAIGTALVQSERPVEALPWFEQALGALTRSHEIDEAMATRQARASAYWKAGRPDDAIHDLEIVLPYYGREQNTRFLERIYEVLAGSYAQTGRWQEAYSAEQKRVEVQRKLFDAQRDEHAARLRVEFDTERREEENRALARENALRSAALRSAERIARLQTIVIVLTVLLAVALAILFWRQLVQSRRMRTMALTDELTRLPNRRHIMAVADEAFAAAGGGAHPLSVIAFDIDRFKRINDVYGHAAGDIVLRRVAHVCRMALRPADAIGRTGGEEFLVVLRDTTAGEAVDVAERLRAAVEASRYDDVDRDMTVTISLGVSTLLPGGPDRFDVLARAADELLYRAKETGRNRVVAMSAA
jgi:diguanylate cyclase (GGDEF)-like protein